MVVKHSHRQLMLHLRRPGRAGIEGIAYCLKAMPLESRGSEARVFTYQHSRTGSVGLLKPKSKRMEDGTVAIDIN